MKSYRYTEQTRIGECPRQPSAQQVAPIVLLFLLFYVALQLQREMRLPCLHLPGALSAIPGPNPAASFSCRRRRDGFDGHVFCTEKSWSNCILPKVSVGEKTLPSSLVSVDVQEPAHWWGWGAPHSRGQLSPPQAQQLFQLPSPSPAQPSSLLPPSQSLPGFFLWIAFHILS